MPNDFKKILLVQNLEFHAHLCIVGTAELYNVQLLSMLNSLRELSLHVKSGELSRVLDLEFCVCQLGFGLKEIQ